MDRSKREFTAEFSDEMFSLLRRVHVNMPWTYLPRYLELVLELRMNVEIGFGAEELDSVPRSALKSAARTLQQAGCRISLHGPFWDINPGSVDALIRQMSRFRLQQFFDLVPIFQPIRVVCHTGFDPRHHQGHRELILEHGLEFWEALVRRAEAEEVPLQIENVFENGPEFHKELLRKIDSPCFGFCLDVGHQHSFSKTPLAIWLEELTEYLGEVHLHDNDGTKDSHLPVGKGNIDFALLFGFLEAKKKAPLLTLEPHREEDLAESLERLTQLLPSGRV